MRKIGKLQMNWTGSNLIWILVFIGVLVYLIYNVYLLLWRTTVNTEIVHTGKIEISRDKDFYILRDEYSLRTKKEGFITITQPIGKKLQKGVIVAEMGDIGEGDKLQSKIKVLDIEMKEGLNAKKDKTTALKDLDDRISASYRSIQEDVLTRQPDRMQEQKDDLMLLLNRRNYISSQESDVLKTTEELNAEKTALLKEEEEKQNIIRTPISGVLNIYSDGLEKMLSFENKKNMNITDLKKIDDRNQIDIKGQMKQDAVFANIVSNHHFYFVTEVEEEDIKNIKTESPVEIIIQSQSITSYLEEFYKGSDGKFIGLFRVENEIFDFYNSRKHSGKLIYQNAEGIEIPVSAVTKNQDGVNGVYVVDKTNHTVFKEIPEILARADKKLICKYNPREEKAPNKLEIYDEIIVNASNIKEGQKVR